MSDSESRARLRSQLQAMQRPAAATPRSEDGQAAWLREFFAPAWELLDTLHEMQVAFPAGRVPSARDLQRLLDPWRLPRVQIPVDSRRAIHLGVKDYGRQLRYHACLADGFAYEDTLETAQPDELTAWLLRQVASYSTTHRAPPAAPAVAAEEQEVDAFIALLLNPPVETGRSSARQPHTTNTSQDFAAARQQVGPRRSRASGRTPPAAPAAADLPPAAPAPAPPSRGPGQRELRRIDLGNHAGANEESEPEDSRGS